MYGPNTAEVLDAIKAALGLRESMRSYLRLQIDALAQQGQPVVRPLWFDLPGAELIEDQFMFGPAFMVAPVLWPGATTRLVVFPGDNTTRFQHHFSGVNYTGGSRAQIPVSLSEFPLFHVFQH